MNAVDVGLRAAVGAVTAGLAPTAGPVFVMAAGIVGIVFARGWLLVPVAVATAVAAALVPQRGGRPRLALASLGGVLASAALRLPTSGPSLRGVIWPAALFLLIWLPGWAGLAAHGRRRVAAIAAAMFGAAAIVVAVGTLAAFWARQPLDRGVSAANQAISQLQESHNQAAATLFGQAQRSFRLAHDRLTSWWAVPGRVVPVAALQLRALDKASLAAVALTRAGRSAATTTDLSGVRVEGGQVPLDRIVALDGPVDQATSALDSASATLRSATSPWLVAPLHDRLDQAVARLARVRQQATRAATVVHLLPGMLGATGVRRYYVAMVTPSESRGSGGLIGNYSEVVAEHGKVEMPKQGRVADLDVGGDVAARRIQAPADWLARYSRFDPTYTWGNITMSPNFPATAQAIMSLYPQSGGGPIDGVIAVDPTALADLLKVVGPIKVRSWPTPLTSENAAHVLLFDEYLRLSTPDRLDFLSEVAKAAFQRLTEAAIGSPKRLTDALSPAIAGHHLMLASSRRPEENSLIGLGVGGALPAHGDDGLGVVVNNAVGNKIDWFVRKVVDYQVSVDPADGLIRSRIEVGLQNLSPTSGLPDDIIGSSLTPPPPKGTDRSYVSIFTPWRLTDATVDGSPLAMESEVEAGWRVYSTYIVVPPGGLTRLVLNVEGTLPPASVYRLDVFDATSVAPEQVTVHLNLAPGWRHESQSVAGSLPLEAPTPVGTDRTVLLELRQAKTH